MSSNYDNKDDNQISHHRRGGFYNSLKTVALTAIATLGLFTTPAQAHDDHSKEFVRRRHVPTMFDTPIRYEYPRGLFAVGAQGAYDDDTRTSATGLRFFTPYATGDFNYHEGHTRLTRDQTYEGRFDLGVAKEEYSIHLGFSFLNGGSKQKDNGSRSFTDSEGLLNTVNETEKRVDKDENYSVVGELHKRLGDYGEFVVSGMAGKNKRREDVDINNTTRVTGTITVPGAPVPIDIDVTVNTIANVDVKRTKDYIDLALVYKFPLASSEFGLGPWVHLTDIETTAKLYNGVTTQKILDDRVISRSAGLDGIVGIGHPKNIRVMATMRGGSLWGSSREGISDSTHRFTAQGTFALTARPFDKSTQYTLSFQGAGMAGREFYQVGVISIKNEHSVDKEPNYDSMFDKTYGIEALLLRETSLRSDFDERFDVTKKQDIIFDLYQLDMHQLAGEHGLLAFNAYFENINSDRVGGMFMITAPYLFSTTDGNGKELCPNIGLFVGGYFGRDSKRDTNGFNQRDYMWAAGVSWRADLDDTDLIFSLRGQRTGGPDGMDTSLVFGLNLGWGYESKTDRPDYHELFKFDNSVGKSKTIVIPKPIAEPTTEPEQPDQQQAPTSQPVKKSDSNPGPGAQKSASGEGN